MIYVSGDLCHFWDRLKKPPTSLSACFFLSDWLARMEQIPRATSEATVRVAESQSVGITVWSRATAPFLTWIKHLRLLLWLRHIYCGWLYTFTSAVAYSNVTGTTQPLTDEWLLFLCQLYIICKCTLFIWKLKQRTGRCEPYTKEIQFKICCISLQVSILWLLSIITD